jgi:hypothetical protein
MILRPRLYRWCGLLLPMTILLLALSRFVPLPLRDSDRAGAARTLVAWIVDGRSVSGFGEAYPDASSMPKMRRFFVICDFLPPEDNLSDDPRVQRITAQEHDLAFKKHGFADTDYLFIELKAESGTELVVEVSNLFGSLAGHGYRFGFHRTIWGLRANGKRLWVS